MGEPMPSQAPCPCEQCGRPVWVRAEECAGYRCIPCTNAARPEPDARVLAVWRQRRPIASGHPARG